MCPTSSAGSSEGASGPPQTGRPLVTDQPRSGSRPSGGLLYKRLTLYNGLKNTNKSTQTAVLDERVYLHIGKQSGSSVIYKSERVSSRERVWFENGNDGERAFFNPQMQSTHNEYSSDKRTANSTCNGVRF